MIWKDLHTFCNCTTLYIIYILKQYITEMQLQYIDDFEGIHVGFLQTTDMCELYIYFILNFLFYVVTTNAACTRVSFTHNNHLVRVRRTVCFGLPCSIAKSTTGIYVLFCESESRIIFIVCQLHAILLTVNLARTTLANSWAKGFYEPTGRFICHCQGVSKVCPVYWSSEQCSHCIWILVQSHCKYPLLTVMDVPAVIQGVAREGDLLLWFWSQIRSIRF